MRITTIAQVYIERDIGRAKALAWAFSQCLSHYSGKPVTPQDPEHVLRDWGIMGVFLQLREYQEFIFEGTGIQ